MLDVSNGVRTLNGKNDEIGQVFDGSVLPVSLSERAGLAATSEAEIARQTKDVFVNI